MDTNNNEEIKNEQVKEPVMETTPEVVPNETSSIENVEPVPQNEHVLVVEQESTNIDQPAVETPETTPMTMTPVTNTPVEEAPKKKKNKGLIIVLVIILILLLIGGCTAAGVGLLISKTKSLVKEVEDTIDNSSDYSSYDNDTSNDNDYESNTSVVGTGKELNIIVTGHVNHGQDKLMIALSKEFNGSLSDSDLNKVTEERDRGITISTQKTTIKTDSRDYNLTYTYGMSDTIKSLITTDSAKDGAIIVVSAADGPMAQTKEELKLLNQIGVDKVVVFLNKCEMVSDDKLLKITENEIRDILDQYGFDKNKTPIIRGSADKALEGDSNYKNQIKELMKEADNWLTSPQKETEKDFLMPIEDVFTITGRGTVATGRIERGTLKLNDEVEIVGIKDTKKTTVTGIEMFRKQLDFAEVGDNAGILLKDISKEEVERGQVLAKPGTIKAYKKFSAIVYILSKEEGGRHTPFFNDYKPQFYIRTTDVSSVITLPEGTEMVMPGDNTEMKVELTVPIALEKGTKFSIREGGRTVGAGIVTKIIE